MMLCFIHHPLKAQTWSPSVNISNMPGLDNMPDFCIDSSGALHCVFSHKISSNWWLIYYSKSGDDGISWSTPENISRNDNLTTFRPHIEAGSNNTLHVTYDFNSGNPAATQVYYKYFDGTQWNDSMLLTQIHPGAHGNFPVLDHNDRLYCFWYWGDTSYYRFLENGTWSDIICPYPDEDWWIFARAEPDKQNNLHCVGTFLDEGQIAVNAKVIYFSYLFSEDQWSDKTLLSEENYLGGHNLAIDIDGSGYPRVVWHQRHHSVPPDQDSTLYRYFNGSFWPASELIVRNQSSYEQRIAIDDWNNTHIIDRENLDNGTMLVHYQKANNIWQGKIIDSAENSVGMPEIIFYNGSLYLIYVYSEVPNDGEVVMSKYDIITDIDLNNRIDFVEDINVYPNPFSEECSISFLLKSDCKVLLNIYDMKGYLLETLSNSHLSSGKHIITWDGKDENNNELPQGLYLIRLVWGSYIITRLVNKIN